MARAAELTQSRLAPLLVAPDAGIHPRACSEYWLGEARAVVMALLGLQLSPRCEPRSMELRQPNSAQQAKLLCVCLQVINKQLFD